MDLFGHLKKGHRLFLATVGHKMSQLLPRYLGWLATTLSALFLVACAASGITYNPAPSPTANDALVYIYRTDSAAFSARSAYFYVDDVKSPI